MQIFSISKNHNFNISCINKDYIYNVQDGFIFKRNIYDFDNPLPFSEPLKEEPIGIFYTNSLILAFSNKLFFYENEKVKKIEILQNPILKIKKYKKYLLILTLDNKIYTINKGSKGSISIQDINKDIIVDFCLNQNFTFFLNNSGLIFKSFSILFTDSLNLRKPMKIIPEPSHVKKPNSIYFNSNNLFLCYDNFIEVYKINDNILNLIYKYNTNFYKIIEGDKIYCLDKTFNLLGEYPKVVINNLIENKIGKVCLIKGRMYVLEGEEDEGEGCDQGESEGEGLYDGEGGFDDQRLCNKLGVKKEHKQPLPLPYSHSPTLPSITTLFFSLRSDFEIKSNSNKDSILKDFDSLILDKYRRFFLELSTVNDSLLEKKKVLDKLENKILEKIKKRKEKYNEILEKIKKKNGEIQ